MIVYVEQHFEGHGDDDIPVWDDNGTGPRTSKDRYQNWPLWFWVLMCSGDPGDLVWMP